MAEITFNGKNVNSLEAKLLIVGLNLRVIKPVLTDEENKAYSHLKNLGGNGKKALKSFPSERGYLIHQLTTSIKLKDLEKKMKYCQEHGHKERKNSSYASSNCGRVKVWADCSRCGVNYERELTSKERKDWDEMMKEEVTI